MAAPDNRSVREIGEANHLEVGTGFTWAWERELNPRPTDYESRAGANSAGPREPNEAI